MFFTNFGKKSRKQKRVDTGCGEDEEERADFVAMKRNRHTEGAHLVEEGAAATQSFQRDVAEREFFRFSNGEPEMNAVDISNLAQSLGWHTMTSPRPDFFFCFYVFWEATDVSARSCSCLTLDQWMHGMEQWGCSTPQELASEAGKVLDILYNTHSFGYLEFHRFVFSYLLVSSKLGVRSFARTVDIEIAAPALMAVLCRKSPFLMSFQAFLSESKVKYFNMDQWMSFLHFGRTISYPSFEGYHEDHCWPILLDDYVEWSRSHLLDKELCYKFEHNISIGGRQTKPYPAGRNGLGFGDRRKFGELAPAVCSQPHCFEHIDNSCE